MSNILPDIATVQYAYYIYSCILPTIFTNLFLSHTIVYRRWQRKKTLGRSQTYFGRHSLGIVQITQDMITWKVKNKGLQNKIRRAVYCKLLRV